MSFLLILPLAIFAAIILLVAGTIISVEIAERHRARAQKRRIFRPVVIEGGKGKLMFTARPQMAPAETRPIRLVRSAPQ
jgi:hypothetical protein